ncbi:penicillin-binding protein activator [Terrihabitans sp. B22-R8]|uniref:penicillin-binding protein activator n=1 Tax=Terrihabitans sp. B22-R8 TaxID=3425128 RepID=UPI00403C1D12
MISAASFLQTLPRFAVLGFAALGLGACVSSGGGSAPRASAPESSTMAAPTTEVSSGQLDAVTPGAAKVALILPLTASGGAGEAGRSMKNAGELALAELGVSSVQLIVKDDGGTPAGAASAAQEAVNEGAEIILGPLFAQGVVSAGRVAKGANVPLVAFSTDASAATNGVYLLSFLPQSDVNRIVAHAAKNGKKSFAALLPEDAYGSVVEGAFQEAVAKNGGRVVALERFANAGAIGAAAGRIAQVSASADAIFVPDEAPAAAAALAKAGVDLKRVTVLGTGLWDDGAVQSSAALAGGLYAAPDTAGWRSFQQRYRARYGSDPARTSTLAYDAVSLAAALSRSEPGQRYTAQALTNASGFQGVDGIFRLRANGLNERGLAVLQVGSGGAQIVAPAPKSFAGAAGF